MRSISTRTTGLLLVVLGVWGGLVPFIGHYFHFALGPDKAWTWTTARLYLDILPGVATVLGGLILMGAGPRGSARLGALLALAGGIWFAIGPEISQLWHAGGAQGAGHGSAHIQMLEMLTYHTGLGVVIAALAGYAFPRFPVVAEEVAAPRRGRAPAAAGAGPLAARWDRRADDETGEPMTEREAARAESGTRQDHLGRDAAIGAGAAGGAVAAEHHHREHVAEEDAAAGDPVGGPGAAQGDAMPADAGTRQHHLSRDTAIGAGAAGAVAAEHRYREHVAEESAGGEPVAERDAAGEPVAERDAEGEPVAERDVAGATDEPVPERDMAGTADQPVAADTGPATTIGTTRSGDYSGHSKMRRRSGGLLGSLLRR
jgi:hypothetical protein